MIHRRSSRLRRALIAACSLLGLIPACESLAEPLGLEPSLSLSSLYDSNPFLVPSGRAAGAGAVQASFPLTYTTDAQSFDLGTSFRFAKTVGDTQLLTDYQYVNVDWRLTTELDTVTTTAAVHRDTTFYDTYENAAVRGHSLPRLDESAGLAWQRALSERSHFQFSSSYDQENFSEESGLRLQSFNYAQASASYDRTLTERWTSNTAVGYGHYDLRETDSTNGNRFVQTSVSGALGERWTGSAQIGYSRVSSSARAVLLIGPLYVPIHESSSTGVNSYSFNLNRAGDGWSAVLSAARTVQPSALGQVLAQENVSLGIGVPLSERLTFGASVRESEQSDPLQHTVGVGGSRYYAVEAHANLQWAEHWSVSVMTGYNWQRLGGQAGNGTNLGATLTLTRQFDRIPL
jgi:hypothetical protein